MIMNNLYVPLLKPHVFFLREMGDECANQTDFEAPEQLRPCRFARSKCRLSRGERYPIPSMYGIFTYIWLFLMGKYGKCR